MFLGDEKVTMNIIGLGTAGCNIAQKFSQHPQYDVFLIDTIKREGTSLRLAKKDGHEAYEGESKLRTSFFQKIKGECLFVVCGAEAISGLALRILEKFSGSKIEILYIKPDVSLLPEIKRLQERATFNVLQQYARSGLFEKMYVIENIRLENILGEVQIIGYHDKLNDLLVSTMHMINIYKRSDSEMDTFSSSLPTARISTIGVVDYETGEEKLFYDIQLPREKMYFYAINREQLATDGTLFKKIKTQIKSQIADDQLKVSYGVFSTEYPENYVYSVVSASLIQEQKIN